MRVRSADGVLLAVHDLGGHGDPLLLSHANGFHAHVFTPLAGALGDRFHCYAPDYRGHGESGDPPTDIGDWSRFGDDAVAVAGALELRAAVGFGHSLGATALLMAELARAGTFGALVLYEPITFPASAPVRSEAPGELAAMTRRRRAVFASREEALANYAGKPPLDRLQRDALEAYVRHGFVDRPDGSVTLRCDPEHEARIFEGGAHQDTFARLGQVACPVLVLAGAPEGNPPGAIAPVVAGALPRGRFVGLPELSHFGPMEDPERVAALVVEFAAEMRPAR